MALSAAASISLGASGPAVSCGPFTDVTDPGFCPFVLEIFYLGITTGTTPTTYDPGSNVTRLQMAAFLSRTVDRALQRGGRRAALQRFWTAQATDGVAMTTLPGTARFVEYDGADLWVSLDTNYVSRVRAGDGKLLETWTGAGSPGDLLMAMGRVFVTGGTNPGRLYQITPSLFAGAVTTVASTLGGFPAGIAFDGTRVWTANADGTVSILTPGAPWTVTTAADGYQAPRGILYDGSSIWITDNRGGGSDFGALLKLDGAGGVLQIVTVGFGPAFPVFDGSNIWVPHDLGGVSVVRASTGAVLKTLSGAGLAAAFDGERVLVGNALYKAADLTLLQPLPLGGGSACSDGMSFWITLGNKIARY